MSSAKKRILHVITGTGIGGAETALLRLLQHMDRERFDQEVVSLTEEGPMANELRKVGIPVRSLHLRSGLGIVPAWVRLKNIIRDSDFDMVQSWMYHADLLSLLATKFHSKIPLAWNIRHSNLSWDANSKSTLAVARLCALLSPAGPDAIVVCAEAARESHRNFGYDASRMIVIPNGVDTTNFRPHPEQRDEVRTRLGIPLDSKLVGLVARFHPQKDHATFITMAALLLRKDPLLNFVLIGDGCTDENLVLKKLLADAQVSSRFTLLGPRSDVIELYAAMDLHVLSSRGEGFPNVLAEAMSCAVPCVSTRAGDALEILGDETLCCEIENPQALSVLAAKILGLNSEDRMKLGLKLRERIHTHFSMDAMKNAYQTLYERLIRS